MKREVMAALAAWTVMGAAEAAAQVGRPNDVLEANLATREQLLGLPHVNAAFADAIAAGRPYGDMLALDRVVAQRMSAEQKRELYRRLFLPINLNAATREEILLVPGVGDGMASEFLAHRPYDGLAGFRAQVGRNMAETEVVRIEQYIFVPIDLNHAVDADIRTIPGVGDRMLREFKEYRPYRGIEQFRREIGKYVDAKEVARLERYVVIRN